MAGTVHIVRLNCSKMFRKCLKRMSTLSFHISLWQYGGNVLSCIWDGRICPLLLIYQNWGGTSRVPVTSHTRVFVWPKKISKLIKSSRRFKRQYLGVERTNYEIKQYHTKFWNVASCGVVLLRYLLKQKQVFRNSRYSCGTTLWKMLDDYGIHSNRTWFQESHDEANKGNQIAK